MVSGYADFSGGLENVVSKLQFQLGLCGVDVSVYAERQKFYLPRLLSKIYYRRCNLHKWVKSLGAYQFIKRGDFDLVHGHGDNCLAPAIFRGTKPFIVTLHGIYPKTTPEYLRHDPRVLPSLIAERLAVECADVSVACSLAVKKEILEYYKPRCVETIYNGVDVDKFVPCDKAASRKRLGLSAKTVYALWVGHDPVRKGLDVAKAVLQGFPSVKILPFGLSPCSCSVLVDAYNAADFLIFPSKYEGFPLVPMEALACGLPMVVSEASNMGEILTDGKQGFIVGDGDYADRVACLLDDSELRLRMSGECRKLALQYSWKNQAAKYLALYRRLVS
jgi:glycosyltransferase involved in cell wall biosynthesis